MTPPPFPELAALRLGTGVSRWHPPPRDAGAVMGDLAASVALPPEMTTEAAIAQHRAYAEAFRDAGQEGPRREAAQALRAEHVRQGWRGLLRRIALAVDAPVGFGERLVQFWANHFTIRADGPPRVAIGLSQIDDAIRPRLSGYFADLLRAAILHPGMILYLEQTGSVGPNSILAQRQADRRRLDVNENLARELIELHTLGVDGAYTQGDVRALADLLTGLGYTPQRGVHFGPQKAEPGAETVLGRAYGGEVAGMADIHAVLEDLAVHPDTARHIARKLAVHFTADTPDESLVSAMEARFIATGGHLGAVYEVLLDHPALAAGFRSKARQPFEVMVACFRALGVTGGDVMRLTPQDVNQRLLPLLRRMGHDWGRPPGPNGLPEVIEAWITPPRLAARIDWAMRVVPRLIDPLPDAREALGVSLGSTVTPDLAWAVPRAETNAEGIGLMLASAEFNRR